MVALRDVTFVVAVIVVLDSTDGTTTYINSPGYPLPYRPISVWRTAAPVKPINGGMRVKLTVTMMNLAYGDTVGIYDGSGCSASDLLETFKGGTGGPHPNINKVYFSTVNSFCIVLRAPIGFGKGFSMKTEEVYRCQGTYTEDKGDIISPGFPVENYETSRSCRWSVIVDQGQRIEFNVMELDFDPGNSCPTYLRLSGVQADYSGKICQSSMQGKTIVSTSTDSDVIFQSRKTYFWTFITNEDSGHRGFWLAYKAIGCKAKFLPKSVDTTGHHINKNKYYANSYIAKYACNPGYWFSDKRSENWFICRENEPKQWYGTTKQCIEIRCGVPPVPADGKVSLSNEDKMDSVATYTCDTNFNMDGKDKRTCLGDGTWSGKTPDCNGVHVECSVPGDPPNGKQIGTAHSKGDSVSFECDMGYELEGQQNITCLQDGKWSSDKPVCKEITCRPRMPPQNGFLVTNATTLGSIIVFKCLPGYKINGPKAIECLPSGNWSRVEPVCELITCPDLSNPYDGKMVLSGLTPGNTAAFSCNLGFDLIGPETMKCTADGSWSSPPPFCSKVFCPVLPQNATNGQPMSSAHKYLDVVVYRCDPDYFLDSDRLITEVNVTCQADGVWSENIAGCWYGPISTTTTPTTTTKGEPTTMRPTTTTTSTTVRPTTTSTSTTVKPTTASTFITMKPPTPTIIFATSTAESGGNNGNVLHSKQDGEKQNNNIYIYIAVAIIVIALVVCIAGYIIYSRRNGAKQRSSSKTKLEDGADQEPSRFENPLYSPELHTQTTDRKSKAWLENPTYNTADDVTPDDVTVGGDLYENVRVERIQDVDE